MPWRRGGHRAAALPLAPAGKGAAAPTNARRPASTRWTTTSVLAVDISTRRFMTPWCSTRPKRVDPPPARATSNDWLATSSSTCCSASPACLSSSVGLRADGRSAGTSRRSGPVSRSPACNPSSPDLRHQPLRQGASGACRRRPPRSRSCRRRRWPPGRPRFSAACARAMKQVRFRGTRARCRWPSPLPACGASSPRLQAASGRSFVSAEDRLLRRRTAFAVRGTYPGNSSRRDRDRRPGSLLCDLVAARRSALSALGCRPRGARR